MPRAASGLNEVMHKECWEDVWASWILLDRPLSGGAVAQVRWDMMYI